MTERIVALDPGGTTGWAYWQDTNITSSDNAPWNHFSCGQLGPEEHHEELYELLERLQTHKFTIVDETFEFRQSDNDRTGTVLISREYIGVAKLFARQRKPKPEHTTKDNMLIYVQQSPSQAKGFCSDEKLKALGLYVPGQKHARDALKHLVYYLVNRRHMHNLILPWKALV